MAFGEEEPGERREGDSWVQAIFDIAFEYTESLGPMWSLCRPNEEANPDGVADVLALKMCPQWLYTSDRSKVVFRKITIGLFDIWEDLANFFGATSFDVSQDCVSISGEHEGTFYTLTIYYEPVGEIDFVFGQLESNGWSEFHERMPLPPKAPK